MQPHENLLFSVQMKCGSLVLGNQFSGQGGKSTVLLAITVPQPKTLPTMPELIPEQRARQQIDAHLVAAGWVVQDWDSSASSCPSCSMSSTRSSQLDTEQK